MQQYYNKTKFSQITQQFNQECKELIYFGTWNNNPDNQLSVKLALSTKQAKNDPISLILRKNSLATVFDFTVFIIEKFNSLRIKATPLQTPLIKQKKHQKDKLNFNFGEYAN